jgi:tRNA(fMet)-specific endonuclease VapC
MRLYMLDTNMVSYIIKARSRMARNKLASLKQSEAACISAVTEAELRYGIAKSSRAPVVFSAVEAFLAKIQVLPWGSQEARAYGVLRAKQESQGKPLGNLDIMIAAHAVAQMAILVTNDKAFQQVPDLPGIVNWAIDL